MFSRIIASLRAPSHERIVSYLDDIFAACSWEDMYKRAELHLPNIKERERFHAAIWSRSEYSRRAIQEICKLTTVESWCIDYYELHQTYLFMASGEPTLHNYFPLGTPSGLGSAVYKKMIDAMLCSFEKMPDDVLVVLPTALAATRIVYTDITPFLEGFDENDAVYPKLLKLAYLATRGTYGERSQEAITDLIPYFDRVLPPGLVDSLMVLEEDSYAIIERIDGLLSTTNPTSKAVELPEIPADF